MTDAEFHQQQLEQQEYEEVRLEHLNKVAYQCLGAAQALRDISTSGQWSDRCLTIEKRLIELANTYDNLRRKYYEQN